MSATAVRFTDVEVQLSGTDGNAFAVMCQVTKALNRAGREGAVDEVLAEATSGDYDHLLQTCFR